MRRLKKILVGLDGSSPAFHALIEAMRLAQWAKGRVTAIVVAPSYEGDLSLVGLKNPKAAIEGPSGAILATAFEMAESAGMQIGVICEAGETHERVAERARDGRFDVIVLGFERRWTFRQSLFGTMHAKLASRAHTDILVVPHPSEIAWERAFYLDWLPQPSPEAFAGALDICAAYGSQLFSGRLDFTKARDAEIAFYSPIRTQSGSGGSPQKTPHHRNGAPRLVSTHAERSRDLAVSIAAHLAGEQIGMFFLPYRAGSGIGGWLTRRFFERLILESPCPVMILRR